jgi:hypothetical protein
MKAPVGHFARAAMQADDRARGKTLFKSLLIIIMNFRIHIYFGCCTDAGAHIIFNDGAVLRHGSGSDHRWGAAAFGGGHLTNMGRPQCACECAAATALKRN